MKKSFIMLSVLLACAGRSAASEVEVMSDTTNVYTVNGEKVPHFSGKELIGETIVSYKILYVSDGGKVYANHQITTQGYVAKELPNWEKDTQNGKTVVILNGKEVPQDELMKTYTGSIKSVTVFKAGGESTIKKFGERGKDHNFIIVETK